MRPPRFRLLWLPLGVALFVAVASLGSMLVRGGSAAVVLPWAAIALLGLAGLLAAGAAVYHDWHHWRSPLRRLKRCVQEIRGATAPLTDLPAEAGGLTPLLGEIRAVLDELRTHRAGAARLSREVAHLVQQRTRELERRMQGIEQRAQQDPLTGLLNRRCLRETLDEQVRRCNAGGQNVCLVMMDMDDFKLLNDTLGHTAGDELLRNVGQLIRSTARQQDLAFRYGGDEFLVVMPGADEPAARRLAQRIGTLVDALARTLDVPRKPRISAGVARLDEAPEPTARALLELADQRLYAMKSAKKSLRAAS